MLRRQVYQVCKNCPVGVQNNLQTIISSLSFTCSSFNSLTNTTLVASAARVVTPTSWIVAVVCDYKPQR